MKSIKLFLIIAAMACLTFSCEVVNEPDAPDEKPLMLEINEGQSSYITQNGKHFYSDVFSDDNDSNLYRLKVEAGVKYHLYCVQPDQQYARIKMVLLNSDQEVIHSSETWEGRTTGAKPDIIFTATEDAEFYLKVINYGPISESLFCNLYFEKCTTTDFNFGGHTWQSTGEWKVINSQVLEFSCSDSREFRWIRLNSDIPKNAELSLTMKSSTKTELPSFGFIYNGSIEMSNWGDFNEELPSTGRFYNFYEPNTIRTVSFYGNSGSMNYEQVDLQDIDMKNGVNFRITPTHVIVNNTDIPQGVFLGVKRPFYFVIEDKGFDKITVEGLQLQ